MKVLVSVRLPPPIFYDKSHRWYFVDYLEDDIDGGDVETFMFGIGAITAVAFALRFVDLHLENIVAADGKPRIRIRAHLDIG